MPPKTSANGSVFSRPVGFEGLRATLYRRRQPQAQSVPRRTPPRALMPEEQKAVFAELATPRFVDLLASLGVTKSHSRPHVPKDNPYSKSHFKTMKYRPVFPDRFGSYQDTLGHSHLFFHWYNCKHYHSGIGLVTQHHFNKVMNHRLFRTVKRRLVETWKIKPE